MRFSEKILKWFHQYGRKDLPWQHNKTPYRVWVSEIMLQQTQVSTVIPYFEKFIRHFPDIEALALADEDEVLHLWTGLGYYSRARNLQRTAKIIAKEYAGKFPADLHRLQQLPGIGRSTAGAILSIAFQQAAPILDGNVKRVLTRFLGISEWSGEKAVNEQLWQFAENNTPQKRADDYSQAMMDLGATLCKRTKPLCNHCPLQKDCVAFKKNLVQQIPASKPAKKLPVKNTIFLALQHEQRILLKKRPAAGVWKGLWSFPEIDQHDPEIIKKYCRDTLRCDVDAIQLGKPFRHTFSHYHLDISPIFLHVKKISLRFTEAEQQLWYDLKTPPKIGLPAPVKKILDKLFLSTNFSANTLLANDSPISI